MLLLAQHAHETIILETSDGPIELRLHVRDDQQARIGIVTPASVRVVRQSMEEFAAPTVAAAPEPPQQFCRRWLRPPNRWRPTASPGGTTRTMPAATSLQDATAGQTPA